MPNKERLGQRHPRQAMFLNVVSISSPIHPTGNSSLLWFGYLLVCLPKAHVLEARSSVWWCWETGDPLRCGGTMGSDWVIVGTAQWVPDWFSREGCYNSESDPGITLWFPVSHVISHTFSLMPPTRRVLFRAEQKLALCTEPSEL
jgi:hypothetical protein